MKLTQAKLFEQAMSPKKFGLPKVVITAEELGVEEKEADLQLALKRVKKKRTEKEIPRAERLHWKE